MKPPYQEVGKKSLYFSPVHIQKITCQIFSLAGGFFTSLQEKLKTESPCKSRFFGFLIFRNILDFAEDLRNFKKAYKGKFLTASKLWNDMTYFNDPKTSDILYTSSH